MANDVSIRLVAHDDASATFDKVADKAGGLSNVIETGLGVAFGSILTGAIGLATNAFNDLVGAVGNWINDAMAAEKIDAQLSRAIKSAGDQAAITTDQANKLAEEYKNLAGGSDEAVKGAETVLLRFRSIGKDAFPQVLRQTLDLAAAMGTDAESAALALGKALESPGEGLMRLRAAGVIFTDEQEKQIKAMVDAGNVAGAQQMILDKLAQTTGGAAATNAATFSGKMEIMKNRLDDAGKSIGQAIVPGLSMLFDKVIAPALPLIEQLATRVSEFVVGVVAWISDNFPKIQAIVEQVFGNVQGALGGLGDAFGEIFNIAKPILEDLWSIVQIVFGAIAKFITENQETIKDVLGVVWDAIRTTIETALRVIGGIIKVVLAVLQGDWQGAWDAIKATFEGVWNGIVGFITRVWDTIKGVVLDGINSVIRFINDNFIAPINNAILSINQTLGTQFGTIGPLQYVAGSNGLLPGTVVNYNNSYNYSPTYGSTPSSPRADFYTMQALAGGQ